MEKTLELILVPTLAAVGGVPLVSLTTYYFDKYLQDRRLAADIGREIEEIGKERTARNNDLTSNELGGLLKKLNYPFIKSFINYLKENLQNLRHNPAYKGR